MAKGGKNRGGGGHGVSHPGSRGGHPWTDKNGHVRYGPKPTGQRAVATGRGGGSGKARVGELRPGYRIKAQTTAQKTQAKKKMLAELDKTFKSGKDPHGNPLDAKTLNQVNFLATSLRTELHGFR